MEVGASKISEDVCQRSCTEVDVLVFGAGAGGMTAALVAALEGKNVVLCEATQQVGGTTATSAGTIWIPGNHQSLDAGFQDSQEAGLNYLDNLIGSVVDRARREAFIATGPSAIDYLAQKSDVKFLPSGRHPDYVDLAGAAVSGRALAPLAFDGRLLGKDFERIRAPIGEFLVLGGMMVGKADIHHLINSLRSFASFWYSLSLFTRYFGDRLRYARGTRLVMGNALVARLYNSLLKAGVSVWFEAKLTDLEVENCRVVGAWVETGSERKLVRARNGIVSATGGLSNHPSMRAQSLPQALRDIPSLVFNANRGAGIAAALGVGAAMVGKGMFWQPVSRTRRSANQIGLFPHLFLDRAKPGLIAVNSLGQRFVNEAASYHHFCEGMIRAHEAVPGVPCWLVCDARFIRKYGLGHIPPGTKRLTTYERSGYLVCSDTVRGLAGKLEIDEVGLARSIELNNRYAEEGIDRDFGRGSAEVNRFNGDPDHKPNPCVGPIRHAPFCAMAVWPADAAASRGLATNEKGAVLRQDGTVVDGLFACGNDMASIMNETYPGPGATLGPAIVFGYIIGKTLAINTESEKSLKKSRGAINEDVV